MRQIAWTLVLAVGVTAAVTSVAHSDQGFEAAGPTEANTYDIRIGGVATLDGEAIEVSYSLAWRGESYPGPAECQFRAFDQHGDVAAEVVQIDSLQPEVLGTIRLSVKSPQSVEQAEGSCAVATPPTPASGYEFSNVTLKAEEGNNSVPGDEATLRAIAAWTDPSAPPGTFECSASAVLDGAEQLTHVFTLAVGDGAEFQLELPPDFLAAHDPSISCSPYTGEPRGE